MWTDDSYKAESVLIFCACSTSILADIFMEARVRKHFKVWITDIYTTEGILLFYACSTHKLAQKHIHGSYSKKTFQGANRLVLNGNTMSGVGYSRRQ